MSPLSSLESRAPADAPGAEPKLNGSPVLSPTRPDVPATLPIEPPATPWPRTDRPLTIAIIGWARLSSQEREGSGYNLNKSELARGLVLSGHKVAYLAAGMTNRLGPTLSAGAPAIVLREQWGGIDCYELRNSPNAAPAAFNFTNMATEIAEPASSAMVVGWLRSVGAVVAHVHSQEGYALDLIPTIEAAGIPVVVTPHNYWFLCPQVDLLHHEHTVCTDYDGGRKCQGCLPGKSVAKLRTTRAWGQSLEYLLGLYPADVIRKLAYGVKPTIRALAKGQFARRWTEPKLKPDALNDPELALGFDSVQRDPLRGTAIYHHPPIYAEDRPRDYARAEWSTNEQLLDGRDRHRVSLTIYGKRRDAGVAALSAASLVTPPSDYLRKVHVAMGVPENKTRWVRLGQPHFDQINRRARRSPFYDARPWDPKSATRPLRFGFFGTTRPNKGLEVLTRAIPLLAQSVRERCQFIIRAQGYEFGFRKRLSVFPEVSVHGGYDLYELISAAGTYDVGILSHIWLENSPLVLLENFHAGKMVICSRLGGPVDWIRTPEDAPDAYNGLFFTGGDEHMLAQQITRVVTGEVPIPSQREIHDRTTLVSYPAHVREVESIYHELIRARRNQVAGPAATRSHAH